MVVLGGGIGVNVAVTLMSGFMVTLHVPVPVHAPDQANCDPLAGVAVSVTGVPSGKTYWHAVPQLIPAGELVTVPAPVPPSVTVSVGR
jgi:hypothetical protein